MKMTRGKWAIVGLAVGLLAIFMADWVILQLAVREMKTLLNEVQNRGSMDAVLERLSMHFHAYFFAGFGFSTVVVLSAFSFLFREFRKRATLETELREAKIRSETIARSRGELLSNVSHEIRAPLGAMLSFYQILAPSSLEVVQQEMLEGTKMATESLVRLANDLLDLSKMDAGKMAVEARNFKLRADVLRTIEQSFLPKSAEKKISFKIEIAPDTPDELFGDPIRVIQILTNLLENAVKFTHRGYVFLLIEAATIAEKGNHELHFLVKDTGEGIPTKRLPHVFDRFEQADRKSANLGAGLGLAIVRDLAVVLGGSVSVESHVGFGTTFSVRLPFRSTKIAFPENQIIQEKAVADLPKNALWGLRILLAEDNPLSQKLATIQLEEWGAVVRTASNGSETVAILSQSPGAFDLVLMDMTMPEMDGWEATHRIRTDLKNTVLIIALTGHAQAGEREKCLSVGMDGYVTKPLDLATFLTEIAPVLEQSSLKSSILNKAGSEKILNLRYLIDLSQGKKTFVREMLNMFQTQAPAELEALRQAVDRRDFETIRTAAHNLKSTAAYVGMSPEGLDILEKLEMLGAQKGKNAPVQEAFLAVEKVIMQAKMEAEAAEF